MSITREYGKGGRVGIAAPQANPVVEPEMSALMPAGVSLLGTRLVSEEADQRTRFIGYLEGLERTLKTYDILALDALGFACTASSYLVGIERDRELTAALSRRYGYPIVTGAEAIVQALAVLGVGRVAVVAPYPPFVLDAGTAYLRSAGIDVVAKQRVMTRTSDTRTIYELTSDDALAAAAMLDLSNAECILFSGTGMPSLRAIKTLSSLAGKPLLSSNLCLAWALARALGCKPIEGMHPLFNGWQDRLDRL